MSSFKIVKSKFLVFNFFGILASPVFVDNLLADSIYTKAADTSKESSCSYKETKESSAGPGDCEYICNGPVAQVQTRLQTCADYDHLWLKIDGVEFSTWEAMMQVGGFSGMGNKKSLVEWVFAGKSHTRDNLLGAIIRFNGNKDPNTSKSSSELAVFGLKKGEICWKGNVKDNEGARNLLSKGVCKEQLKKAE